MEAHEILAPALQKYYSALKSLYDFGQQGDFFDDVSNLDKFFSEFRNITFVIQKAVGTEENREIYSQLRTKYLAEKYQSGLLMKGIKQPRKDHSILKRNSVLICIFQMV